MLASVAGYFSAPSSASSPPRCWGVASLRDGSRDGRARGHDVHPWPDHRRHPRCSAGGDLKSAIENWRLVKGHCRHRDRPAPAGRPAIPARDGHAGTGRAARQDPCRRQSPALGGCGEGSGQAMDDVLLEARNLSKRYGGLHAVADVTLSVRRGEILRRDRTERGRKVDAGQPPVRRTRSSAVVPSRSRSRRHPASALTPEPWPGSRARTRERR